MSLDDSWFSEPDEHTGTAFSLKGRKIHEETTPYQTIAIWETQSFGYLMTIDGCTMVTTLDNFLYHEMMTHPVLNSHPHPKQVVVVGGGDCGTLREVLKHPEVESATQCEIDERVTRLSEQYFPELCTANDDARATLYFGDAIDWIQNVEPGSVDVIIVDSTDPIGPAEGLFGKRFYGDCFKALAEGGMLVHQSESPLLHQKLLHDMHQAMREAGYTQTRLLHFPQPIYPGGWWSASIACKSATPLVERLDASAIAALDTRYYSADTHRAAFSIPPFLKSVIAPG